MNPMNAMNPINPINPINMIMPYKYDGMWVFDDARVDLKQEPFVGGADAMIDSLVKDFPNADTGFVMLFSDTEFPASFVHLQWARKDSGGNIYHSKELGMEGWLCPALLRYYPEPPKDIFIQVKPKT